MSSIYLIRHGQASYGAENYDVLSELGAQQSHALGAYFARRGLALDACYAGPRHRHIDTAGHFAAGARAGGLGVTPPIILEELDEYPILDLLKRWLPALIAEDPAIASGFGPSPDKHQLERGFLLALTRWSRGELDTGDVESFAAFQGRVYRAIDRVIANEGRRRHIAVFTSNGPISVLVQRVLGLASDVALRTGWVLANTSLTELRYRDPSSIVLFSFNTMPHLLDNATITYR